MISLSLRDFFLKISHVLDIQLRKEEPMVKISTGKTTLQFHGRGKGDEMAVRQLCEGFTRYLESHEDPELGKIVISCGTVEDAFLAESGNINLYWLFSPRESLEKTMKRHKVDPDAVLLSSPSMKEPIEELGYETLHFPFGVSKSFRPLGLKRRGFGYSGKYKNKPKYQVEQTIGACSNENFEEVTDVTDPWSLNLWYNSKLGVFDLTSKNDLSWGVVGTRVFEVLASGTPLITYENPTLNRVLGFDYPFQVTEKKDTRQIVSELKSNKREVLEEFEKYSEKVRGKHSYKNRLEKLIPFCKQLDSSHSG